MEKANRTILGKRDIKPVQSIVSEMSPQRKDSLVKVFLLNDILYRLSKGGFFIALTDRAASQIDNGLSEPKTLKYNPFLGFHYEIGDPKVLYIPTIPEIEGMIFEAGGTPADFIMQFLTDIKPDKTFGSSQGVLKKYLSLRNEILLSQQGISHDASNFLTYILIKDYKHTSMRSVSIIPSVHPDFEEVVQAYIERAQALGKAAGFTLDQEYIQKHLVLFHQQRIESLLSKNSDSEPISAENKIMELFKSIHNIGRESLSSDEKKRIDTFVRTFLLPKCLSKLFRLKREISKSRTDAGSIAEMEQSYDAYKRNLIALARFFGEDITGKIAFMELNAD